MAVLDHFDSFFEQRVSQRSDVQLKAEEGAADDPPFPTDTCLAVLSATYVLLENCSNKAAYNSSEVGFSTRGLRRLGRGWGVWHRHTRQIAATCTNKECSKNAVSSMYSSCGNMKT